MLTEERRRLRGKLANRVAAANAGDRTAAADVEELRRQYRAAAAEDYIRQLVDSAPPLTPEMRDRLALLLRGGAAAC